MIAISETLKMTQNVGLADRHLMREHRASTTPVLEKLYRGVTHPLRLLPDFLIIGAQRGGTTSLYHYLQAQLCLELTATKELHFFDRRFHEGLAWYRAHFPTLLEKYFAQSFHRRAFLTGEATPGYLFHPHAPKRVADVLPHVKLIVLLRNPVDRAYSHYHHIVDLGYEHLSFEEAIHWEEERIGEERKRMLADEGYESYSYEHFSYLSRGRYVEQLQVWMRLFPFEQFLILKSEDFYADPVSILQQVLTFLEVPQKQRHLPLKDYAQHNHKTSSQMDAALRTRLLEYFRSHNAALYNFLGVHFGWDT